MVNEPSKKDTDELRKRQERLEALKSKRVAPAAVPAADKTAADGVGAAGLGGGGMSGAKKGPRAKRGNQRKMLIKAFKIMTQTPEDDRGRVPDTPFTQAGVARLMGVLQDRSSAASQPGAKMAKVVLKFLQAGEGEDTTASGASIAKLQAISRRVKTLRSKGGGAGGR